MVGDRNREIVSDKLTTSLPPTLNGSINNRAFARPAEVMTKQLQVGIRNSEQDTEG